MKHTTNYIEHYKKPHCVVFGRIYIIVNIVYLQYKINIYYIFTIKYRKSSRLPQGGGSVQYCLMSVGKIRAPGVFYELKENYLKFRLIYRYLIVIFLVQKLS